MTMAEIGLMQWLQWLQWLGWSSLMVPLSAAIATAAPDRLCAYDPDLGIPNPLGMRAYITLRESDSSTTAVFEQFPMNLGYPERPVTLAVRRELTFYDANIEAVRERLLADPDLYADLVGYTDPEGFGPVNEVLVCEPVQPQP